MNLTQSRIVLRPRSVAEILDLACLICGARALRLYLWLALAALLPCYGLMLALRYWLQWDWSSVWLCAAAVASLAQGVYTLAAGRWLFSGTLGVGEVLRAFAQQLWRYFWAWALSIFLLAASGIILLVPWAGARLLFVHEASLLEMASPTDAASRSSRFVSGRGWRALWMWCTLLCAQLGCVLLAELLCNGIVDGVLQLGQPFESLWSSMGSPYALLGLFLSVPYVATARFLMYIDNRTRADGWDIQVRFMAIASDDSSRALGATP